MLEAFESVRRKRGGQESPTIKRRRGQMSDRLLRHSLVRKIRRLEREAGVEPDASVEEEDADSSSSRPSAWGDWDPLDVTRGARVPAEARVFSIDESQWEGLSEGQRAAVSLLEAGLSVFVTGPGGTGKSHLINLIRNARPAGDDSSSAPWVCVTASTGIAALNIGGITLHRFAGIGLGKEPVSTYIGRLRTSRKGPEDPRISPWLHTKLLIVDEISMLTSDFLGKLDTIARWVRSRWRSGSDHALPFGGLQLMFCGDFAQLTHTEGSLVCWSRAWPKWVPYTVSLQSSFRQRDDASFLSMLHRIRLGRPTRSDLQTLNTQCRESSGHDAIDLAAYKTTVASVNQAAMDRLSPMRVSYGNTFKVVIDSQTKACSRVRDHRLLQNTLVRLREAREPEALHGGNTHVAAEANAWTPQGAASVYDAQGVGNHEHVRAVRERASILVPADATLVQRMIDATIVEMNLEPAVELAMGAHVLVTRNLNQDVGLVNGTLGTVVGFTRSRIRSEEGDEATSDPEFVAEDCMEPSSRRWPFVRDLCPEGWPVVEVTSSGRLFVIRPHPTRALCDVTSTGFPVYLETETMPLLCAWAITVHRAQGMTLDRVRIHISGMKRPAQLYTALSRARTLESVVIQGRVTAEHVVAHPGAVEYYDALASKGGVVRSDRVCR